MTFDEINDATGFANGCDFCSEQEVRDYFILGCLKVIYGDDYNHTQEELNEMAEVVILNGWHMINEDEEDEYLLDLSVKNVQVDLGNTGRWKGAMYIPLHIEKKIAAEMASGGHKYVDDIGTIYTW